MLFFKENIKFAGNQKGDKSDGLSTGNGQLAGQIAGRNSGGLRVYDDPIAKDIANIFLYLSGP